MIHRCDLCKGKLHRKNRNKIKGGYVCNSCFSQFLPCIQESAGKLTKKQLLNLKSWCRPKRDAAFSEYGMLRFCVYSIQIQNQEIPLKYIDKLTLKFHPDGRSYDHEFVSGRLTLQIKIRGKSIFLEEDIMDNWVYINYSIIKKEIYYRYPPGLVFIIEEYNKILAEHRDSAENIRDMLYGEQQHTKTEPPLKEDRELNEAMRVFGVRFPFTKKQIKTKRNKLLKEFHPDNGGTVAQCTRVNEAYEILIKIAK